jgi:ketosteroid isomerase-like protein
MSDIGINILPLSKHTGCVGRWGLMGQKKRVKLVSENYCCRSVGGEPHCCAKEIIVKQNILLLLFCMLLSSCVFKEPNNNGIRQHDKERNEMRAKDAANEFVSAINQHNVEAICRLMTKDHTFIDSGGGTYSGTEMRQGWIGYFKMFPDYTIDISEVFVSGETVVLIGEASGTYTSDGILKPENHWGVPAVWKAVVAGEKVRVWQMFADNTLVSEIVKKDKTD